MGDNLRISLNLFNMKGLVDLKSIKWKEISVEQIPSIPKVINEENLFSIPGDRICELETLLHEWVPYEYYLNDSSKYLDCFKPNMILKEARCCGVGLLAMKMNYCLCLEGFFYFYWKFYLIFRSCAQWIKRFRNQYFSKKEK